MGVHIHIGQKMETAQMLINRCMEKTHVVHIHNSLVMKGGYPASCDNVDGP